MASWIKMDRGCGHKQEVRLSTGWYRMKAEQKDFFASACPTCGYVKPSEDAVVHTAQVAPQETAQATAANPARATVKTNRYPGRCRWCNSIVPAGQGRLVREDCEQTWLVACLDARACQDRITSNHALLDAQAKLYYNN